MTWPKYDYVKMKDRPGRAADYRRIEVLTKRLYHILKNTPYAFLSRADSIIMRVLIEDIYALQRCAEKREAIISHPGNLVIFEIETTVTGKETVWLLGENKKSIHKEYERQHYLPHFLKCVPLADGYTHNLNNFNTCEYCKMKVFRPIKTDDNRTYCSEYDKWMSKQLSEQL